MPRPCRSWSGTDGWRRVAPRTPASRSRRPSRRKGPGGPRGRRPGPGRSLPRASGSRASVVCPDANSALVAETRPRGFTGEGGDVAMTASGSWRAWRLWCAGLVVGLMSVVAPVPAVAQRDWRPTLIGGDQDAIFRFPQAVAFDASGAPDPDPDAPPGPYVYVADQHSFFVQKFTPMGASSGALAVTGLSRGASVGRARAPARRRGRLAASVVWRSTRAATCSCWTRLTRGSSGSRGRAHSSRSSGPWGRRPGS